jgi:hypothetical protein
MQLISKIVVSLVSMVMLATVSLGQELNWKISKVTSQGNGVSCNEQSVQIANAGTDMTLLFDNMRAEMFGNSEPNTKVKWGKCNVGLEMTIPKNYFLLSANTSLLGGVLKDTMTQGYIDASTFLVRKLPTMIDNVTGPGPFGKILQTQKIWRMNESVNEPLIALYDQKNFNGTQVRNMCEWTKSAPATIGMIVQLTVNAQRNNTSKTVVIAADNIDSHFDMGLKLSKCK